MVRGELNDGMFLKGKYIKPGLAFDLFTVQNDSLGPDGARGIAEAPWFPGLRHLDLGNNLIAELPPTIGKLEKLEELVLKQNKLRALPAQIATLQSLFSLDVSENLVCLN